MVQDRTYTYSQSINLNILRLFIWHCMKILFSGCSNTWGDELDNPETERYSYHVAKHFNAEEINVSDCGASVHMVATFALQWIKYNGKPDVVVIQWPPFQRSEFWRIRKKRLAALTPQDFREGSTKPDDHQSWAKFYFQEIHNDSLACDRWFLEMYAMENVMRQMGIKYVTISHNQWHHKAASACNNCDPDKHSKITMAINKIHMIDYCPIYSNHLQQIPEAIHGGILPKENQGVNTPEFRRKWLKPRSHPNEAAHIEIANHIIGKIESC